LAQEYNEDANGEEEEDEEEKKPKKSLLMGGGTQKKKPVAGKKESKKGTPESPLFGIYFFRYVRYCLLFHCFIHTITLPNT
jgi:hypothetical protein